MRKRKAGQALALDQRKGARQTVERRSKDRGAPLIRARNTHGLGIPPKSLAGGRRMMSALYGTAVGVEPLWRHVCPVRP